jgi:hypothetical protein
VKFCKVGGKIITQTGEKVLELVKDGSKVLLKESGELGKALTGPRLEPALAGPVARLPQAASKELPNAAFMKNTGKPGGGGGKPAPKPEHPKAPERVIPTREMQNACWEKLKQSGEWKQVPGYSQPTLRNERTRQLIQKSHEKFEMEVFDKNGKHVGIMRANEGTVRTEFATPGRKIGK